MRRAFFVLVCAAVVFGLLAPALGQNNLGVAPPPTHQRASAPAVSIIVYENIGTYWQDALDAMGLAYSRYTVEGDFVTALNAGSWDLICIDHASGGMTYLDDVQAYMAGHAAAKLIVFEFTMDSVPSDPLWATMGAQFESDLGGIYEAIGRSDSTHSVWQRSNVTPTSLTGSDVAADNGDYMSALAGARAVGYSNTNDATHARIICREDHRTVLNSFLPHDYSGTDADTDGIPDIRELMMNEVIYCVNNGWSILLYQDDPTPAPVSFKSALDRLHLIYTLDSTTTPFLSHLGAGYNWALVLVDQEDYTSMNANWPTLNTYLNNGGRLIVADYDMDATSAEPLWATMGASHQLDLSTTPVPIYRWLPSNILFTRPMACPDLTTWTVDWFDDGGYIQALANATAVAGLNGGTASQARVVARNDGRAILNAFLPVEFGGATPPDADSDGVPDVTEWLMNQIALAGGHENFTYYVDDRADFATYWDDISTTGTNLALTDDGEANIDLTAFAPSMGFWFHGIWFGTVRVGANGGVAFDEATNVRVGNLRLPLNQVSNYQSEQERFFAPFWDDLNPSAGGEVRWQVKGTAPWRRLIVQWTNVPYFGGSTDGATFQIQLFEGWNAALALYQDMSFGNAGHDYGAGATIGVSNDFADAVQYSYNTASLSDGMGIVMTPWAHAVDVPNPTVNPTTVVSGGSVAVSGTFADLWAHAVSAWIWTANPAIGTFDNIHSQATTYHAPVNAGTSDIVITLRCTGQCNGHSTLADFGETATTLKWDYDGDLMQDKWELDHGLSPTNPADALLDPDRDGLNNRQEYQNNCNLANKDTDGDGFTDWEEVELGSNPASAGSTPTHGHFNDVPASPMYPTFHEIEAMLRYGITGGCSAAPPLYCPTASVTRKQMAKFLCLAAGKTEYNKVTPTFADVPKADWSYGWVERLADPASWGGAAPSGGCRIVGGIRYYCPNDPVTRAQMAKFLCVATGKAVYNKATPTFADVPKLDAFYGYIERLADPASWGGVAVTSGCAAGPPRLYCPTSPNTRSQMAVFLLRAFALPY